MKNDLLFLLTGYGSELTLGPLYEALSSEGFLTLMLDFLTYPNAKKKIQSLRGKRIVFITSSHLLFDEEIRSWFSWKKVKYISPVETISLLNPIFSIYYPHDLGDQIQEEEETYLSLFDLVLGPDSTLNKYPFIKKFKEVGYIKLLDHPFTPVETPLFLPTNVMKHYGDGIQHFLTSYRPVLEKSIVKFPHWDYTPKFEKAFKENGIDFYPAEENSVALMQKHAVVIGEGCSSSIYEASKLGKKVIYLKNSELDHKNVEELYKEFDSIVFTTVHDFPSLNLSDLPSGKRSIKSFDKNLAIFTILQGLAIKGLYSSNANS